MCDLREKGASGIFFRTHYYPFGLPIYGMGSTAAGFKENRRKYQSNEYIKDIGLNWMDFNFRQYDPQIGRFLGVDPLAASGGQERFSPYAAMGNAPESMVDPDGLQSVNLQKAQAVTDDNVGGWATDLNFALWGRKSNGGNNGYGANQGTGGGGYGGASDQIFLYGEQARATWAKLTGQRYVPEGEASTDGGMVGTYEDYVKVHGEEKTPEPKGRARSGSSLASDINSMFGSGTFIASNALSFVAETKAGTGLSMGGFAFRSSAYSVQKGMLKELGKTLPMIKGIGTGFGLAGIGITLYDIGSNGLNAGNGLDLAMGGVSFIPGVGWIIGGVYFIGNGIVEGATGKTIGQHAGDYGNTVNGTFNNMGSGLIETFGSHNYND